MIDVECKCCPHCGGFVPVSDACSAPVNGAECEHDAEAVDAEGYAYMRACLADVEAGVNPFANRSRMNDQARRLIAANGFLSSLFDDEELPRQILGCVASGDLSVYQPGISAPGRFGSASVFLSVKHPGVVVVLGSCALGEFEFITYHDKVADDLCCDPLPDIWGGVVAIERVLADPKISAELFSDEAGFFSTVSSDYGRKLCGYFGFGPVSADGGAAGSLPEPSLSGPFH